MEFVAASVRQRETVVPVTDAREVRGQTRDDAALTLIERRPDHQVGDAGLVAPFLLMTPSTMAAVTQIGRADACERILLYPRQLAETVMEAARFVAERGVP
jgi:hypothetical protein